jgi:uncharacterized repeat protein (TIGR03803 family)
MSKILRMMICGLTLLTSQLQGQTFSVIHNFTNTPDGRIPLAGLVLSGNVLYGTTYRGGGADNGIVFKVNTDGSGFTVLHSFSALGLFATNADGANPQGNLAFDGDNLFGTARNGGYVTNISSVSGNGTVFVVGTNGTSFSVLDYMPSSFPHPMAGLLLESNRFYGTIYGNSHGTVFAVNPNGTDFTTSTAVVGSHPQASLVFGSNTLYGTVWGSGGSDYGSVFAISTNGTGYSNLVTFSYQSATNGGQPAADLVMSGETLYGTCSSFGGVGGSGGGTVFKINTDGTGFTILKNFVNNANDIDGSAPAAGLVLSGSTLYGTTKWGGSGSEGTVFRIGNDGTGYVVLKNFSGSDGANPVADLVLDGSTLYGTTSFGGSAGFGLVFSLTAPPPSLQITGADNLPIIFWVDDGRDHTLQTTTNLAAGKWLDIPSLNWTNNSGGTLKTGYQIPNPISGPSAFFRLQ